MSTFLFCLLNTSSPLNPQFPTRIFRPSLALPERNICQLESQYNTGTGENTIRENSEDLPRSQLVPPPPLPSQITEFEHIHYNRTRTMINQNGFSIFLLFLFQIFCNYIQYSIQSSLCALVIKRSVKRKEESCSDQLRVFRRAKFAWC